VTSASETPAGIATQFTATGTYSDGSTQDLTAVVTWSSSDPSVVFSTAPGDEGLATGASAGTISTVTAGYGGITSSPVTIAVTSAVLTAITVSTSTPSIPLGNPAQFIATGTFSDGSSADVTDTATWSSDAPAVATVSNDPGAHGVVTTFTTGSANVYATLEGMSAYGSLSVTAAVLVGIAISPTVATLVPGQEVQLSASGVYSDNSLAPIGVTWSSSDASVATVSATGLVHAVWLGAATISATDSTGSFAASVTVTVDPLGTLVLSYITLEPGSVKGGKRNATGTVVLTEPASQDVVFALASDSPYAAVPPTATVAAGNRAATFTVTTSALPAATKHGSRMRATIRASDGTTTKHATLLIRR
jgi:hypothetical protein